MIQKIVLALFKKEQLIAFVVGVIISLSAGVLGMSPDSVKDAICKAPVVTLP